MPINTQLFSIHARTQAQSRCTGLMCPYHSVKWLQLSMRFHGENKSRILFRKCHMFVLGYQLCGCTRTGVRSFLHG
jgi:hypothetical protein